MNAEVKQNVEKFTVQKLATDRGLVNVLGEDNNNKSNKKVIIYSSCAVVIIIILVIAVTLCLCTRRRTARKIRGRSHKVVSTTNTTSTSPKVYTIPTLAELKTTEEVTHRYQRSVSNTSNKSQVYLVPFSVLPPNFDFSSREVEVRADFVVLKNLEFLKRYPSNGRVNEAYEVQQSYNPNIPKNDVSKLRLEEYQQPPPYNPVFY